MTTTTRLTDAAVTRMAAAGYEAKHAGHPGVTWASAVKSVRDHWCDLARAVATGEIDSARQLYECWRGGRDLTEWQGLASPMGRRWAAVLSAMRIARTEGEA